MYYTYMLYGWEKFTNFNEYEHTNNYGFDSNSNNITIQYNTIFVY